MESALRVWGCKWMDGGETWPNLRERQRERETFKTVSTQTKKRLLLLLNPRASESVCLDQSVEDPPPPSPKVAPFTVLDANLIADAFAPPSGGDGGVGHNPDQNPGINYSARSTSHSIFPFIAFRTQPIPPFRHRARTTHRHGMAWHTYAAHNMAPPFMASNK